MHFYVNLNVGIIRYFIVLAFIFIYFQSAPQLYIHCIARQTDTAVHIQIMDVCKKSA